MAFIDDDEFILPRSNQSIAEVVDEILIDDTIFSGLEVSWMTYGSNGQNTADFSRGVLERFTYRAAKEEKSVKSILNPRRVDYMWTSHFAIYFEGFKELNQPTLDKYPEKFTNINSSLNDKILINHYHSKSLEEYLLKRVRGDSFKFNGDKYTEEFFKSYDKNEVFDDEILRYRTKRLNASTSTGGGDDLITTFAQRNQINFDKLLKRLSANLLPGFETDNAKKFFDNPLNRYEYFNMLVKFFDEVTPEFFTGRLEIFLTCLHLSNYLKKTYFKDELGKIFEEFSLYAIYNLFKNLRQYTLADVQIISREMPYSLSLSYPVVKDIRLAIIKLLEVLIDKLSQVILSAEKGRLLPRWKEVRQCQHFINWLKTFENYTQK